MKSGAGLATCTHVFRVSLALHPVCARWESLSIGAYQEIASCGLRLALSLTEE